MRGPVPPGKLLITAALMTCSFLTALDQTVVGTAMPTVVGSLGGLALYSWVFSVYLLTGTVSMPIYGKLADLYGRKPVFMAGTLLFLAGSMLCGFAESMEQLILFRAVQGLGSGAVLPITMTILGDLFSIEQRARISGLFSVVWGTASILGPAIGGFLTDFASWRWIFFVNLPIGLAAMGMLHWALRETVQPRRHRIDYVGALLLSVGMTVLLLAFLQGGQETTQLRPEVLLASAVAVAFLGTFVWWEQRAPEPIIPLDLFRTRLIAAASFGSFALGALLFGTHSFVPPFVQGVLGYSAIATGLPLAATSVGWMIGSMAAGRISLRVGYRTSSVLGACALIVAVVGLTLLDGRTPLWQVAAVMAVLGLGLGCCFLAFLLCVQNAVAWQQRGVTTSSNQFFRSIGGTLGVTFVGAVFNAQLMAGLALVPGGERIDPNALLESGARASLPVELMPGLVLALQQALQSAFVANLGLAVAVLVAAALLPGGRAAEHAWKDPAISPPRPA